MRRMSFAMTKDAMRERRKTVTRRMGWKNLRPGERLLAVSALRQPKEKVEIFGVIEVVDVREERLWKIYAHDWSDEDGGETPIMKPIQEQISEVEAEGFVGMTGPAFAQKFMLAHGSEHDDFDVTRIEFRFVEAERSGS